MISIKKTTKQFIEDANIKHNNFYIYTKVEYINSGTKVCIICPDHGEFWQTPNSHLRGNGCPHCAKNKITKTLTQFIEEANIKHNNFYTYTKSVYINAHIKICITCPFHGDFWQNPYTHLNGGGCKKCAVKLVTDSFKLTLEEFIAKARLIHGDKYDYSKTIYVNCRTKICIICPEHGEFWQNPTKHLMGQGCPMCGKIKTTTTKQLTTEKFIIKANIAHNNFYIYTKVNYIATDIKVCIICPIDGEFWQTPHSHLKGCGCPICARRISKIEIEFLDYLNVLPENRQYKLSPTNLKADGFIPETNTIIEFFGDYFHGNPLLFNSEEYNKTCHTTHGQLYNETFERLKLLKSMGYNIKYIWELDWSNYIKGIDKEPLIHTFDE